MEKLEHAPPSPAAALVAGAKTAKVEGEEAAAGGSKLSWCVSMNRWLPLEYREELHHVLRLTGPLLLSRILNFLLSFVITIFCGHIGNAELAGYALASATINVTTAATGYGLAVACDTLMSQTFGSRNLQRVGVILQRSALILLLFCLPCWALLINSHNLLLLLQQEDEVARIAQLYITAFLPAVPAMFLHQLQVAYLQNQGIILPQMYTAAAANLLNLGFNYVLIFSLDWGVVGSAVANSLSQVSICALLFGYIRWKKLHLQTWGGWSTDCLQEWGSYMKLAVPSAFMICFEWWIWEFGGFLAGVLGEVDLAAQHVLVEIGAIIYMIPLGINAAACVRVGNALGAGNTRRAVVTCKVVLVLSGLLAVVQGVVIAGSKSVVGFVFTSDQNIVELVSQILTVNTFVQFFDALLCVCSGILVGAGLQKVAALSNLICYYCIGLPVGVALMFAAKLRILGLWFGLFVCTLLETGLLLVLIFKLDWKKVTQKAQSRAGQKVVAVPTRPASVLLSDAVPPAAPTAQPEAGGAAEEDGYDPVSTQDPEGPGHNPAGAEAGAEQTKNPSSPEPQDPLSVTQLVLRRGSTVLLVLLVLATGVAVHVAFPAPEPSSGTDFAPTGFNDSVSTAAPLDLTSNL